MGSQGAGRKYGECIGTGAPLSPRGPRGPGDQVGYSGLMLACLEDTGLASAAAAGRYDIMALLMNSCVCGIGLDTVPSARPLSPHPPSPLLLPRHLIAPSVLLHPPSSRHLLLSHCVQLSPSMSAGFRGTPARLRSPRSWATLARLAHQALPTLSALTQPRRMQMLLST